MSEGSGRLRHNVWLRLALWPILSAVPVSAADSTNIAGRVSECIWWYLDWHDDSRTAAIRRSVKQKVTLVTLEDEGRRRLVALVVEWGIGFEFVNSGSGVYSVVTSEYYSSWKNSEQAVAEVIRAEQYATAMSSKTDRFLPPGERPENFSFSDPSKIVRQEQDFFLQALVPRGAAISAAQRNLASVMLERAVNVSAVCGGSETSIPKFSEGDPEVYVLASFRAKEKCPPMLAVFKRSRAGEWYETVARIVPSSGELQKLSQRVANSVWIRLTVH